MIETQPNYKHHFRERRAMLDTALKMISEGKYHNSAIREIAFHARLAESTALHFYPNSNLLLLELELHIAQEVDQVILSAMATSRVKKTRFLNTWVSLYRFYLRNQGLFKFIDQSTLALKDNDRVKRLHEALNSRLISYFKSMRTSFSATQSAAIFHMSIAGAVKINCEQHVELTSENINALASSCWLTLTPK